VIALKKVRRASRRAGLFSVAACWRTGWGRARNIRFLDKKQGAAGITTAAPRIAGQWGRGDNRLPE
jgi:hypothetical protein